MPTRRWPTGIRLWPLTRTSRWRILYHRRRTGSRRQGAGSGVALQRISGKDRAAAGAGSSGARPSDRHRVAHGGLPGAILANRSGAPVVSSGGETGGADQSAEAGKRGRRERGGAAVQGGQADRSVAALPAGPATRRVVRRRQCRRRRTGLPMGDFWTTPDFRRVWRMPAL